MDKKTVGSALMLLSLIFLLGFQFVGWRYVGDLSLMWPMVWMVTAAVGFALVVLSQKKSR